MGRLCVLRCILFLFCIFFGKVNSTCNAPRPNIDGRAELDEGFQGFTLFQAGQMVYYHCAEGYLAMSGNAASTCQEDGSWTPMSLQCREMECSLLDAPNNGYVDIDSYRVGSIARFSCKEGFEIVGHSHSVCLVTGEFSPSTLPQCEPVVCPSRNYLRNGNVQHINQGNKRNSFMTYNNYRCNQGYRLVGLATRRCQENGQWEGEQPVCQEIQCKDLGPLYNGKIRYPRRTRRLGAIVLFSCNRGAELVPNIQMALCLATEEWSEPMPQCLGKAEIGRVPRGNVRLGNTEITESTLVSHGRIVHLTCNSVSELYSNVQQDYLDRQHISLESVNGTWSPAIPECVFKRCDTTIYRLYKFKLNGKQVPRKVDHNTNLEVYPVARHDFYDEDQEIPAIRQCKKGSIRYLPDCVPAFCSLTVDDCLLLKEGPAQFLDNEKRVSSGTEVLFEVNNADEYELYLDTYLTKFSATCDHGNWNKRRFPICREKRCRLRIGEGAKYSDLNSEKKFTTNMMYIESGTDVQIECRPGYRLVGADKKPLALTTLESYSSCFKGSWSRVISCEPEPCPLTYDDENIKYTVQGEGHSLISGTEVEHGKTVVASCKGTGFQLQQNLQNTATFKTTCERGVWSHTDFPVCIEKPCTLAMKTASHFWTIDKDGIRTYLTEQTDVESGTKVFIDCDDGYQVTFTRGRNVPDDQKYSVCSKGQLDQIFKCKELPCTIPSYPIQHGYIKYYRTNTRIRSPNVRHNSKVIIKCDSGYHLSLHGEPMEKFVSECSRGSFDPKSFPNCTIKPCPLTYDDENIKYTVQGEGHSLISGTEVEHGKTVVASCKGTGFQLQQNLQNTATFKTTCERGVWSHTDFPVCIEMPCTIPSYPIQHGYIKYYRTNTRIRSPNVRHNSKVKIKCDSGYHLSLHGEPMEKFVSECSWGSFDPSSFPNCTITPQSSTYPDIDSIDSTVVTPSTITDSSLQTKTREEPTQGPQSTTELIRDDDNTDSSTLTSTLIPTTLPQTENDNDNDMITAHPETNESSPLEDDIKTEIVTETNTLSSTLPSSTKASSEENLRDCSIPKEPLLKITIKGVDITSKSVPHGTTVDFTCLEDMYAEENMTTCENGDWTDKFSECTGEGLFEEDKGCILAQATITSHFIDVYTITCDNGYELNYNARYYKCIDGTLRPMRDMYTLDSSATDPAKCVLGDCTLPETMPSGMTIQDTFNTFYSEGAIFSHNTVLIFNCPENFEPRGKRFICKAGLWRGASIEWHSIIYTTGNFSCRSARCGPGCGSKGNCISDGNCACEDDAFGSHCEHRYCHPLEDLEMVPHKTHYKKNEKVYDLICKDLSLRYDGPSELICSANGEWTGSYQCLKHSTQKRTYYLHFITTPRYQMSVKQLQIRLVGKESKTAYQNGLHIGRYREWYLYRDIFTFEAEDIEKVEKIFIRRPKYASTWNVIRLHLERRDQGATYYTTVRKYIYDEEFVIATTDRFNFLDSFTYHSGEAPMYYIDKQVYWMSDRKEYYRITNAKNCLKICLEEKTFTCTTAVYYPNNRCCTTLPYFKRYYSSGYYKANIKYIRSVYLYTRNTIPSTK